MSDFEKLICERDRIESDLIKWIMETYRFCDACGYRVKEGPPMHNFCPNRRAETEVNNE